MASEIRQLEGRIETLENRLEYLDAYVFGIAHKDERASRRIRLIGADNINKGSAYTWEGLESEVLTDSEKWNAFLQVDDYLKQVRRGR